MGRASGFIGHDALGCGNNGDTQAAENPGQLVRAGVNAQAGLADAAKAGNDLLLAAVILQGNADDALGAVVDELEALNIALVQQDLRNGLLHVGSGNVDSGMLGAVRVADAGEHIRNGICDVHDSLPPFRVTGNACISGKVSKVGSLGPVGPLPVVRASCVSFASAARRKLTHFAALPLQRKRDKSLSLWVRTLK